MIDIRWMVLLLVVCFIREIILKSHSTYKQGYRDALNVIVTSWNRGIDAEVDAKFRLSALKSDINQLIENHKKL